MYRVVVWQGERKGQEGKKLEQLIGVFSAEGASRREGALHGAWFVAVGGVEDDEDDEEEEGIQSRSNRRN